MLGSGRNPGKMGLQYCVAGSNAGACAWYRSGVNTASFISKVLFDEQLQSISPNAAIIHFPFIVIE